MADWKEVLASETQQHWNKTNKALLLAQLPHRLRKANADLSVLGDRKMRVAISDEAMDVVRLVQNPASPLVWGVIPREAIVDGPLDDVFAARSIKAAYEDQQSNRFYRVTNSMIVEVYGQPTKADFDSHSSAWAFYAKRRNAIHELLHNAP